jgi:hypothetical protein
MVATGFPMRGPGWWIWRSPAAVLVLVSLLVALAAPARDGDAR